MKTDIRLLSAADIPAAMRLKELAGWNQTERDWQRLLELEPEGCFAALCDGRLVGTATTTRFGVELAWIGMVLVDPEYRRRGIATRLMKTAMAYLQSSGVRTIKLDATPAGQPVYEALGFVLEHRIERQAATVSASGNLKSSPADITQVMALDRTAFAADRSRLISSLYHEALAQAVVVEDNRLLGYALARSGYKAHYIGPLVALDGAVAHALLSNILAQLPAGNVYLDYNTGFTGVDLQRFSFVTQRELFRMRCGPPLPAGGEEKVVAIAGLEVG